MPNYDAIVVGARCAGAATAMLLARGGLNVLLLDRARFPSDIPHGHLIHRHGPRRLAEWGLLDEILETNCPPVTSVTMDFGDVELTGTDLAIDGIPVGVGPRRARLDEVLVRAAVAAGAELRDGFAVQEFRGDGERITGVRGREVRGGTTVTERATVVIGADGRNSGLARAVEAAPIVSEPTVACWYFSYWSGVESTGLEIRVRPGRAIFAFPTNDDLFAIFVGWTIDRLPAVRADLKGHFETALEIAPELAERVRAGHREERFYGAAQLPNFVRTSQGPGWALVGDAGCHKDPFLALGVCDALRDAELLADALAGGEPLAGYERRRNEATLADFHENLAGARLQPLPAEARDSLAAVSHDPEATRQFMLAREGMIAPVAGRVRSGP
jgi:flavin-dependent dehydrogenase